MPARSPRRMEMTIEEINVDSIIPLAPSERFRLATLISSEIPPQTSRTSATLGMRKTCETLPPIPRGGSPRNSQRKMALLKPGDVVVVDFPGVKGIKR